MGNYPDAGLLLFDVHNYMDHRIKYDHFRLDNGLEVIIQPDRKRPFVAVSLLYKVGSRNDPPRRTGFAHLFEHLMFAGSEGVDNFDDQLHRAGGENNAYTTNDYTLYYDVVPAENLETALWLESDRMRALNFSPRTLATQQKVVVEEFKETCLEEPYGDAGHHLYGMAYREHPYRWPVIGKDFADIEAAQLKEVKDFFYRYYRPNNAVISLCGNIDPAKGRELIERYFGGIAAGEKMPIHDFPVEAAISAPRIKRVRADVPSTAIYQAYPIPGRLHPDFYALDVLAFLLGGGRSSRLYRQLVRQREIFHTVEAELNDMFDSGLFLIEGRVDEEVDPDEANAILLAATAQLAEGGIQPSELQKVLNKLEVRNNYSDLSLTNRGGELCVAAALGDPEMINTDSERYRSVTVEDLQRCAAEYLRPERRIELIYEPESLA
ncbi:peptidase M16 [Lewinellaceae bacterium SD302]|nr:peptidase M16 [Lewinellaceae bacterium SD302]